VSPGSDEYVTHPHPCSLRRAARVGCTVFVLTGGKWLRLAADSMAADLPDVGAYLKLVASESSPDAVLPRFLSTVRSVQTFEWETGVRERAKMSQELLAA